MPNEANVCLRTSGLTKVFGVGRQKCVAVDHVDMDSVRAESSRSWANQAAERLLWRRCFWD